MSDILLEVRDLRVYFYTYLGVVKAVDGVSFSVRRGEFFSIVGETGCGKSVTARAIMGLIKPPGRIVSGKIIFEGRNLLELPKNELRKIRGREITYIYQDPSSALDPLYTAGYQIAETINVHNPSIKMKKAFQKAIQILREVAIPDPAKRAKSYPHELSGGMKQRVVIGMSIANKPKLVIADEPTTALDVTVQAQILELLRTLKSKYNTTVILITHNLGVVAETSNRVMVMYAGKVVEIADTEELFEKPLHPYTQGLLAAVPNPLKKIDRIESIPGYVPDMIDVPRGCRFRPRCVYAHDKCLQDPPLIEVEKNHWVACWRYVKR